MGKSNIFSLELLYKKQLEGSWSTINDVFVFQGPSNIPNNTGFIGGGKNASQNPAPNVSSTQKIDFANDSATAVTKGSLNTAVHDSGGGSSTTHGYWAGGKDASNNNISTLSRIDYANDTAVASPKGEGPARSNTAGCSNDTHGYWLGGSPSYPRIFRTTWANDTATQVSPGANNPRSYSWVQAAAAGNQDFAWSDGGGGPYSGQLAKLDYANDTVDMANSTYLNFIGGQGYKHVAVGNAAYGYWSSGENHDITRNSRICRVDWANDTGTAVIKGNLSVVRAFAMGSSNPSQGYWIGGTNSTTLNGNGVTYVERIDFANDTTTSMKGPLNFNQSDGNGGQVGARSNALSPAGSTGPAVLQGDYYPPVGADFGYFTAGRNNPPDHSNVDRIDYSNDTAVATPKSPTIQSGGGVGSLSSQNHGYTIGGPSANASIVSRLDFTSDILAQAPKASYQYTTGSETAATGNESFGYISGGGYPYRTSIDRLDYSNDLTSMFLKGNLGTVRARHAAAGNSSFGYHAGGGAPSPRLSSVERIDYSSDTSTASPKGPLKADRQYLAATGNANYGYFGGGYFTPQVDRIDYANDTATASPKGPLLYSFYAAATGDSSYGYWTQGHPSRSSVGRLEYANDTTTASPKGNLALARFDTGALSSRINGFSSTASDALPIDKSATGVEVFGPAFGYSSGGSNPVITTTSRIDYANDTNVAASKGTLDVDRAFAAATSSRDFGFVAGGRLTPGTVHANIVRLDYSNDSSTMLVRGDLTERREKYQATGNANFGYFGGGSGNNNSPSSSSTVQRLNYANDIVGTTQRAGLFRPKQLGDATSSPAFGYFSGGNDYGSGRTTITSRINFSNDAFVPLQKGGLPTQTIQLGATGNKNFGYYSGGGTPAAPSGVSHTNRLDYSNDTSLLSPKGNLTASKYNLKATGSQSFGYFSGGGVNPNFISSVDRLDYSSDTTAMAPKGPLSAVTAYHATYSSRSDTEPFELSQRVKFIGSTTTTPTPEQSTLPFGYVGGGSDPNQKTDIGRIDFSSDTETMITKGNQRHGISHVNSTGNTDFGYTGGGYNIPAGAGTSNIQRADYSNDEATTLDKGDLSAVRFGLYATGNINFGYFAGGREPSAPGHTTVFRSTYASDTAVTSPKGPLTTIRTHGIGSTGNAHFGYFGGAGVFTPWMTSIDRIDYGNDTADASPKGNFSTPRSNFAATGNADFGYFSGGRSASSTPISTVDRVDYSNDTVTASPKGPLTAIKYDISGTGNSNFGYYFGAQFGGPMSRTDRVEYANDTVTASIKANMTGDRKASTAYSAQENNLPGQAAIGYPLPFPVPVPLPPPGPAMGYAMGSGTYVQRIDYTNDTATAPARGPLSATISYHSAVSSKTHGYTFGGSPSPSFRSIVQRVDYANDTAIALTVANLAQPVYRTYSGMGNKTYGYQSGGQRPSNTGTSQIDRIEYANDTATGLLKGSLVASRYLQTACGNLSYGYVCGGSPSFQNNSVVQRTDYSNDTAIAVRKGDLHQGSRKLSSAGTADYGYVAGGTNPELSSTTRIDYSNDTAISVQKGPMNRTRRNFGGMSSPAYAYYTAGAMPYPTPALTSTDRLDYANDTAVASPKGPLSAGMSYFSAASPQDIAGALN